MAISLGTPTQMGVTTGQNPSFAHTHVAGTELVVVVAARRSDTTAISSVTYDGTAMTAVETSPNSGAAGPYGMAAAYRLADPGGKTANVQINWTSANVNYTAAWAIDISGSAVGAALIDSSGSVALNNGHVITVTHTRVDDDTYSLYLASRTKGAGSPTWTPTAPLAELITDYDGAANTISATLCGAQESASGSLSRTSTCSSAGGTAAVCISLVAADARSGSLSATLGTLTAAAAGALAINGTVAATLGTLTSTATGKLDLKGSVSATLGAITLSANGTVTSGHTASVAATLGGLTLSTATGKLALSGSVAGTLGALTLSTATGKLALKGTVSATLGALGSSATGALKLAGALNVTLGALTLVAAGGGPLALGSVAATLDALTAVATAKLQKRQPVIAQSMLTRGDIPSVRRSKLGHRGARRFR